jgi:hypothetical protein
MDAGYKEFEATSLFCPRCRKAVPVRKKLLLVLPTGTKYDYLCAECGAPVGGKVDEDPAEFRRMAPPGARGLPRGTLPGPGPGRRRVPGGPGRRP